MLLTAYRSPAARPLRDFGELAHLGALLFVAFLLSTALGALFATYLRRRALAWTWNLFSLAPFGAMASLVASVISAPLPCGLGLALTTGFALGSLGWGVRSHLEDHRAGGDRRAAAASHRAVLDGFRRRRAEHGPRLQ